LSIDCVIRLEERNEFNSVWVALDGLMTLGLAVTNMDKVYGMMLG
jgi:hypothetical protein